MATTIDLQTTAECDLGSPIGQCRAVPVRLGSGGIDAVLVAYAADFDVDPYCEMFFFPSDTLKLALVDLEGNLLWRRDLGPGVIPGVWFCPVLAIDLDEDGCDEVYFVDQVNTAHPLSIQGFRLRRLEARTGEPSGEAPWIPPAPNQKMGQSYRHFLLGGAVRGRPVLVAAQGTYGTMTLRAHGADLEERWTMVIEPSTPGARGSHMCAVVDIDGDGVDEVLWGERCLSLADGRQLFCAAEKEYDGHSDIVAPFLDWETGEWRLFTARESGAQQRPRVAVYSASGQMVWGDIDRGHMDQGWCARLGDKGEYVAWALRISGKVCGPDGRHHDTHESFFWEAVTGRRLDWDFDAYRTLPVDLNGDGRHELVRGQPSGDGAVFDGRGETIGCVGGAVAMVSKFLNLPGEHLLSYHPDGRVRFWCDANAEDGPHAARRYAHPFYAANQRLTGVGYNLMNLGGL